MMQKELERQLSDLYSTETMNWLSTFGYYFGLISKRMAKQLKKESIIDEINAPLDAKLKIVQSDDGAYQWNLYHTVYVFGDGEYADWAIERLWPAHLSFDGTFLRYTLTKQVPTVKASVEYVFSVADEDIALLRALGKIKTSTSTFDTVVCGI